LLPFSIMRREIILKVRATELQIREIERYLAELSIESLIAGLKFAYKRQLAKDRGSLLLGRKSKVKKETKMLTKDQAKWRLANWKSMIRTYREKGYSYATICRIKKEVRRTA
jgi:DNA-binding transcriptional MerR regulator